MSHKLRKLICALFLSCLSCVSLAIEGSDAKKPFLHPLFSDGMVIQQNQEIIVWGWSEVGTTVKVELAGQTVQSLVAKNGKWQVHLLPVAVGDIYRMRVTGAKEQVTVSDIQVGEVWLCSGQSNMFWPVAKTEQGSLALADSDNPSIRVFNVNEHYAASEQELFSSHIPWQQANAQSVQNFSAVCYFFGKALQQTLKVPVGLIHASWGGTKIEAWTDRETLLRQGHFAKPLAKLDEYAAEPEAVFETLKEQLNLWWQQNDIGSRSQNLWSAKSFKHNDWKTMILPGYWETSSLPAFDGVVWFRKNIFLDENASQSSYQLSLGMIDDADVTWVNGVQVGQGNRWNQPRLYNVPSGLLKLGENTIAVRVFDKSGDGGFSSQPEQLKLINNSTQKHISLAGDWYYQGALPLNEMTAQPTYPLTKNTPSVLFNAMISPILPYKIRGVTWYQGESNADGDAPDLYATQLTDMISQWRQSFATELAFHIVQLANYIPQNTFRDKLAWPKVREAQRLVAKQDPLAGTIVTIDIGNPHDIHPINKLDVGKRLARSALNITYGRDVVPAGPEPIKAQQHSAKIVISYNNIAKGLRLSEGKMLSGFEACTAAMTCTQVPAKIVGEQVILMSGLLKKTTSVRYGWAESPSVNLVNSLGLPAIPFSMRVD